MRIEVWEPLEAEYKPKVAALATRVREEMVAEGYRCSEVIDFTDEDLAVTFVVYPEGSSPTNQEGSVDITYRLLDAEAWDGTESGTSFTVDVSGYGGEIIGGVQPYNYTERVWVDPTDADAVRERWEEFEQPASDAGELLALIDGFVERKAAR